MAEGQVYYPRNSVTEAFDLMSQVRQDHGGGRAESIVSASPAPTVRSASMGPVAVLPPLTPAEQEELDQKLQNLGMGPVKEEPKAYETFEQAVEQSASPVLRHVPEPNRLTAREFISTQGRGIPRLPDFSKVQGFDLNLNVVWVDGMAFSIPETDVRDFRIYAMETARTSIMKQLNEALASLAPSQAEVRKDGDTEVSAVRKSESDTSSNQGGQSSMQSVPPLEQMVLPLGGDRTEDEAQSNA